MTFEVERQDWMRTPGRLAILTIGPFAFAVGTADGLSLHVKVGRLHIEWETP